MLSHDSYNRLRAEKYTLIPVWQRLKNPNLSPLSVYRHLGGQGDDYLFETCEFRDSEFKGLFSYIGLNCDERIELTGQRIQVFHRGVLVTEETVPDPLAALQARVERERVPSIEDLPPYSGGLFGYFGHEAVRMIEARLAEMARKDVLIDVPDVVQLVSKELVIFDHENQEIVCVVHAASDDEQGYYTARRRLEEMMLALHAVPSGDPVVTRHNSVGTEAPIPFQHHFSKTSYQTAVNKIKKYINGGDVMQVVLSQPMTYPIEVDACAYYLSLKKINSTPYSYLLNLGRFHVVGTSPEMLIRVWKGTVCCRPMAGTRRRGATLQEDFALKTELLSDAKEVAEHVMLVDLTRNDLGRVAKSGSVVVHELMKIETFSHVMHIVSTVMGALADNIPAIQVLKSSFPAGTLSGAAKIRALEIINELEPYSRGVYGGAIGLMDWNDNLDLAITIRTGIISSGVLLVQAGAGIVADSNPEREWQETLEKSSALLVAANCAIPLAAVQPGVT